MTSTGWKHPTIVVQDSSKSINNNRACYPFKNLNNIKKADNTYSDQQPWSTTGIDSVHKSPMIYAYNYGFKLPTNATVTSITLFALVQQLTHPKYYYEHYVLKRELRYSVSKFSNVKLKLGTSTVDGGTGNQFASKCKVPMLPYKVWSTEDSTLFTGTPQEWGLTSNNIVSQINNTNFGIAVQFVGTVKNGWCSPGVAQLRMKIDYNIPVAVESKPSTFLRVAFLYDGVEILFDEDHVSIGEKICDLTWNDYVNPVKISIVYYHVGGAGETPYVILSSNSLSFGVSVSSHVDNVDSQSKYTLPKLKCNNDSVEKGYVQNVFIFPGVNVGIQTVSCICMGVNYVLKFNVQSNMSEVDRGRFINQENVCMINNCLFYNNYSKGVGGANYITSEFYNASNNIYGTGSNVNKADNAWKDGKNACPNTYWLGDCYNDK